MSKNIGHYVCPKCKSAFIKVVHEQEYIKYICENNNSGDILCNFEERDYITNDPTRNNEKEPFLTTFLFHNYDEITLRYEHLYLMGEMLKLANMTTLAKKNLLETTIAEKIQELYPEAVENPIKFYFEKIQEQMREHSLEHEENQLASEKKQLLFLNLLSIPESVEEFWSQNGLESRQNYYQKCLEIMEHECSEDGNIFVLINNFFINGIMISVADELIQTYYRYLQQASKKKIMFKRYILVPSLHPHLFLRNGIDQQAIHILHFVKSSDYYYDKVAIVEESFWKKWEFGSRNAPYNPFGKDPGSFWIHNELSREFLRKLSGKNLAQQSSIINNSGQEKFHYFPFTQKEMLSRCLLLGSPLNTTVTLANILGTDNMDLEIILNETCQRLYRSLKILTFV